MEVHQNGEDHINVTTLRSLVEFGKQKSGTATIVCVGPSGSGKTTLLKRLRQLRDGDARRTEMPPTVPTVGADFCEVHLGRRTFRIHEIGGAMAPLWAGQCTDSDAVLFVVDSSNLHQFSVAVVGLLDLLTLPSLRGIPFLVVFGKTDLCSGVSSNEFESAFRLDDVVNHADQAITVAHVSCLTGYGMDRIVDWLGSVGTGSS